jgi:shikimate kinase
VPLRQRSIVLVGMMGSGKSSVGRRLAQRLALPFFDADDEIEHAAGMSIAEMFERYGEPYFRDGERRVIARLLKGPRAVVATGGGAFAQDDTRAIIQAKGLSVWLDVDVPVLVARVAKRSHRPLLVGRDPTTVLTDLLAKRGPAYAQAHAHIRSDARPHSSTVEAIVSKLKGLPR